MRWPICFSRSRSTPVWPRRSSSATSCAALKPGPAAVEPVGLVGDIGLAGLVFGLEPMAPVGAHLVDFALGDDALRDQLVGVDLQRRRMRADEPIHQRLGERRLVALVVAEAPVAEHVDDDRLVELLPVFDRDLRAEHDRFRIVAVDVEDRRLDELGDVGRIGRGAGVARVGGEADLVVDDEMHRAAGAMAAQARKAETLGDHALARESRVAMDQQRQHLHPLEKSLSWSCLARTLPSTTGSTISRCDGLAVSDRCTLLPSNSRSDEAPR